MRQTPNDFSNRFVVVYGTLLNAAGVRQVGEIFLYAMMFDVVESELKWIFFKGSPKTLMIALRTFIQKQNSNLHVLNIYRIW